jgi:cytidylate kinase
VKPTIIAIDGFSSCGKSTLAKALAAYFGFGYVDSGAMYRAVTLYFIEQKIALNDEEAVAQAMETIQLHFAYNSVRQRNETFLNNKMVEDVIRSKQVSDFVSPVATIKQVRTAMVSLQRRLASNQSVVMDGRDIGTHVFPNADLKIFMTADPVIRAKRRYVELLAKGEQWTLEEVMANLKERDHIDSSRTENPLRQASDALVLDNSNLTETEQLKVAVNWVNQLVSAKI